jgi:hypothetical protein
LGGFIFFELISIITNECDERKDPEHPPFDSEIFGILYSAILVEY